MWPFGRRRQGRHALGAVVAKPAVPVSPAASTVAGSIAALIASGEAWADPGVVLVHTVVAPALPPLVQPALSPVLPDLVLPDPVAPAAVVPDVVVSDLILPDPVAPAAVVAPPPAAVRLEPIAIDPPAPVIPTSRVQLGFRDGSTASLDPEQAAALEELAGLLTSRD